MQVMEFKVTKSSLKNIKADMLVLFFGARGLKKESVQQFDALKLEKSALKDFAAADGESLLIYNGASRLGVQRVLLVGLGDMGGAEPFRKAGHAIAREARKVKAKKIAIDASGIAEWSLRCGVSPERLAEALALSLVQGTYRFDRFMSGKLDKKKKDKPVELVQCIFRGNAGSVKDIENGVLSGGLIGDSQSLARDLVNLPGNQLNARDIARYARESGERYGYEVTVMEKDEIERLKMGGLLAVNKGSTEPPTFSILDYNPAGGAKKTVALVGKGVTFDSGGISIKPSNGMDEMKSDMAGAAAVLATVEAAARLELPFRVVGFIPSTDNMPDGSAQKPGDVITTYSGITVEVGNTDAEGRLILADALTYAVQEYKPDVIIDMATLTGACIVALGYSVAGMFSNDDKLASSLFTAGEQCGEKVWRLPLWDEYDEQITSEVADVHNTGGKGAGTITAAKFLEKFVDGHTCWAHVDIAGPSFAASKSPQRSQGGTGFGVSLLVNYLRSLVY